MGSFIGGWSKTVEATVRLSLNRHYVIGRRPVMGFHTTLLGESDRVKPVEGLEGAEKRILRGSLVGNSLVGEVSAVRTHSHGVCEHPHILVRGGMKKS